LVCHLPKITLKGEIIKKRRMAGVFSLILNSFEQEMTGNRKIKHFGAVILAAGSSSRMGKPKYALKFDENLTFAERIISILLDLGCEKITIVLNSKDIQNFKKNFTIYLSRLTVVENPNPERGRFSSIKLGLELLKFQGNVFIINVDNPLFQKETLTFLAEKSNEAEVIIPVFQGQKGHPVLISQPVVQKVLAQTTQDLNFREFLNGFQQCFVEVGDENILVNINTPEDYEAHFTNR
jgi:CTP:molybdopterin cytidylyltransferase MocA